jgi:hypothetical protein
MYFRYHGGGGSTSQMVKGRVLSVAATANRIPNLSIARQGLAPT